jgi:hypothetical protein
MAVSRYTRTPLLAFGTKLGTNRAIEMIRTAVSSGLISVSETVLHGNERLDTLAGELYGDSRYWWVLAAASNIGWALQVPAGTVISVPRLSDVLDLVG